MIGVIKMRKELLKIKTRKSLTNTLGGRAFILFIFTLLICVVIFMLHSVATANDKIFNKCKACHNIEEGAKHKLGPNLRGVYGRDFASAEGYKYSKAFLDRQGIEWTEDNLRAWLKNPRSFIPKSKMIFNGLKKKQDLDNMIEYLKTKS